MPDVSPFAVDPLEAIDFLRGKTDLPTQVWTDLWNGMHARAFVVAGAQSEQLLADFHDAVNRAISEGRSLDQFREDFDRIVAAHGWDYRGSRNWRSAIIFNTNLRSAYAAGRWAQIQRVKKQRPYLRYVHVDPLLAQEGSRPEHAAWHNIVLPVDHPWWRTHFAPNGWNCRCSVQSLNERDLNRFGLKVSKRAPPSPLVDRTINTPDGPVTVQVPRGIDPGFAWNPGEAAFGRGAQSVALEKHGPFEALMAPGVAQLDLEPLPLDETGSTAGPSIRPGDEDGFREALRQALDDEDELIVEDPAGASVLLSQAIVDHLLAKASRQDGRERFFKYIPGLIRDPAEIWVGFAQSGKSGRVLFRRRYIKLIDVGRGNTLGLVADADGGLWSGLTFFRGRKGSAALRNGLRIYRRGE